MPRGVTLSAAVMAHPARRQFVGELAGRLDRPVPVVWDTRGDRWDTGRRALLAHPPEATHHLVVQDDAVVCRNLVAGVERALEHVPARTPVALYVGRVRPNPTLVQRLVDRAAAAPQTRWLTSNALLWGVAVALPTELVDPIVQWGDAHPEIPNYDMRISRWLEAHGIPVWYTWPSLVDHRDSPSLVPGRGSAGRHAHRFIGADRSALDVDWAGGVLSAANLSQWPVDGPPGRYKVVAPHAHAAVPTPGGYARQVLFRGQLVPEGVPPQQVAELLAAGLIAPTTPTNRG